MQKQVHLSVDAAALFYSAHGLHYLAWFLLANVVNANYALYKLCKFSSNAVVCCNFILPLLES